jgi:hypothetical protein
VSDIVKARYLIEQVLQTDGTLSRTTRLRLRTAHMLMFRAKTIRRAPPQRRAIDRKMRRTIRRLVATTDMSMHDIANAVGLRSSGRISEVLHHKR